MSGGYFNWGPEKPSNINEGGNLRRAGEDEPDVLKAKGLSDPEVAARKETENLEVKEAALVEAAVQELNWRPEDAIGNKKAIDLIADQLNTGGETKVRYYKIEDYLKSLAAKEKEKRGFRGH